MRFFLDNIIASLAKIYTTIRAGGTAAFLTFRIETIGIILDSDMTSVLHIAQSTYVSTRLVWVS